MNDKYVNKTSLVSKNCIMDEEEDEDNWRNVVVVGGGGSSGSGRSGSRGSKNHCNSLQGWRELGGA